MADKANSLLGLSSTSLLNDSLAPGEPVKKQRAVKKSSAAAAAATGKRSSGKSGGGGTFDKAMREVAAKFFKVKLADVEIEFLADFFTELPVLVETWDRIGFNAETKANRLELFYDKLRVSWLCGRVIDELWAPVC